MNLLLHKIIKRKAVRFAAAAFLVFAALALAVWIAAPYCVDDPMVRLRQITPAHAYLDRNGNPVFYNVLGFYDEKKTCPVTLMSNKTIYEYDWTSIAARIRT